MGAILLLCCAVLMVWLAGMTWRWMGECIISVIDRQGIKWTTQVRFYGVGNLCFALAAG